MAKQTAVLMKVTGEIETVFPKNKKEFTLEELQGYVGGLIEIVPLPEKDGETLAVIVNEEGKLEGLPTNQNATKLWKKAYPIELYPDNNDEQIVGDILVVNYNEFI